MAHYLCLLKLIDSWWRGEELTGSMILSVLIASLRVAYYNGVWRKIILEALLCGLLTVTTSSLIYCLDLDKSFSVVVGGGVGITGIRIVRCVIIRIIRFKLNLEKKGHGLL